MKSQLLFIYYKRNSPILYINSAMKSKVGGFVYLLKDFLNDGMYKIGVTRGDVSERIKKLQTGNCGEIYLYKKYYTKYPFFIERKLHNRFAQKRGIGEWFRLSPSDAILFEQYCKDEEMLIETMKDNPFFAKYMK